MMLKTMIYRTGWLMLMESTGKRVHQLHALIHYSRYSYALHFTDDRWCISSIGKLSRREMRHWHCLYEVLDNAYHPTKIRANWRRKNQTAIGRQKGPMKIIIQSDQDTEQLCSCAVQSAGNFPSPGSGTKSLCAFLIMQVQSA